MTTNTTIKFRSKFEKILNDENRSAITNAFEKFFTFKMDVARDYLWSLTYNIDIAMLVLEELGLDRTSFTIESIFALRNELRSQYKELNPEFLECEVPMSCKDAYTALEKKSDSIVANIVFRNCSYCVYDEEAIKRTLFLLKSEKDNNRYGGIRSMCFGTDEADYLKQYHMQIHDLLKASYEHHIESEKALNNLPSEGMDENFEEDSLELPFELKNLPEPIPTKTVETTAEDTCVKTETKVDTTKSGKSEEIKLEPASVTVEEAEQNNDVKAAEIAVSKNIASKSTEMTSEVQETSEFKKLTPEEILEHKAVFYVFTKSEDLNVLTPIGILGFDLNEVMTKKEKIFNFLNAASALSE